MCCEEVEVGWCVLCVLNVPIVGEVMAFEMRVVWGGVGRVVCCDAGLN